MFRIKFLELSYLLFEFYLLCKNPLTESSCLLQLLFLVIEELLEAKLALACGGKGWCREIWHV
jgi:hypothetical protein